jgi:hypothetical protein
LRTFENSVEENIQNRRCEETGRWKQLELHGLRSSLDVFTFFKPKMIRAGI